MPLQIIPVEYVRASISCDWPACTNRIALSAIPADYDAEIDELDKVRPLALRFGWTIDSDTSTTICSDHTPPENKETTNEYTQRDQQ